MTKKIEAMIPTNINKVGPDGGDHIHDEYKGRMIWHIDGLFDRPDYALMIADKDGENVIPYLFAKKEEIYKYIDGQKETA